MSDEELFELLAGKHRFQDVGKVLHVAIIDFLTCYTPLKKLERFGKSFEADIHSVSV